MTPSSARKPEADSVAKPPVYRSKGSSEPTITWGGKRGRRAIVGGGVGGRGHRWGMQAGAAGCCLRRGGADRPYAFLSSSMFRTVHVTAAGTCLHSRDMSSQQGWQSKRQVFTAGLAVQETGLHSRVGSPRDRSSQQGWQSKGQVFTAWLAVQGTGLHSKVGSPRDRCSQHGWQSKRQVFTAGLAVQGTGLHSMVGSPRDRSSQQGWQSKVPRRLLVVTRAAAPGGGAHKSPGELE
eukprot:scaffold17532_cov108-Isochrysis_galbana.AAC.2